MADQVRIREEPIRIPAPVDIRIAPPGSEFAASAALATSYGGVSGRRTTRIHVLYTGGGNPYPSDVMEGLKNEELRAINAPVADPGALGREPVAVWLFPPGNRAYHLPRAAVHILSDDVEISALAPAAGWVEVPPEYATDEFAGTSRLIPADSPYFAYETYRAIFRQAKLSVLVVDRYARAGSVLPLMTANPVKATRLLIDKDDIDLTARAAMFSAQYKVSVEVRHLHQYPMHDRFIVLDNRHVWHLGASLNTLKKASMVRLLETAEATGVMKTVEGYWATAIPSQLAP